MFFSSGGHFVWSETVCAVLIGGITGNICVKLLIQTVIRKECV